MEQEKRELKIDKKKLVNIGGIVVGTACTCGLFVFGYKLGFDGGMKRGINAGANAFMHILEKFDKDAFTRFEEHCISKGYLRKN